MKRLFRTLLDCLYLAVAAIPGHAVETALDNPGVPCDHCACYDWDHATLSISGNQNARKLTKPGEDEDVQVIPDADGKIKLTLAVSMTGTGECCTDIGIVSRITDAAGKTLDVTGLTIELVESRWAFPLRIHYHAKKDAISTVPLDAIPCARYKVIKGDCSSGCYEVCKVTADPSGSVGSVKLSIPVGVTRFGDQEAFIEAHFDTLPNPGRSALKLVAAPEITATVDGTGMTGVATDSISASISSAASTADPNRYIITVSSDPADPTGTDFRTITVESLTANTLRVSTTFGVSTRVMEWTRTTPSTGVVVWTFTDGNGLLKVENTKTEVNATTREERVKTYEQDPDPINNGAYLMTSDRKLTYSKILRRWELVAEVIDPDTASLASSWSYHATGEGVGLLATFNRYDGHSETHSYVTVAGKFTHAVVSPFADGALNSTSSSSWDPAASLLLQVTTVGNHAVSKSETIYTALSKTVREYSDINQFTATVTTYKDPAVSPGLGGKPELVVHPDGTITTYDYNFILGSMNVPIKRTMTISHGVPNGSASAVVEGTATTTHTDRKSTVSQSQSVAVGSGNGSILDLWHATGIDVYGRVTGIEYFTTSNPWTTSTTYNCCGVESETDRYGVTTTYTYDDLKRRVTSTRIGVTTETVHAGLTTRTHRYAVGGSAGGENKIAIRTRDLANLLLKSESPDPSALNSPGVGTPGSLTPSTTATSYAGNVTTTLVNIGGSIARNGTTGAFEVTGGDTQTTASYPDGRTATSSGPLEPAMNYEYTSNGIGLVITRWYPDGTNRFEITIATTDWAGRTVTVSRGGATTTHAYNSLGQLKSITDPDNVRTLFAYNSRGERTTTALDIDGDSVIDYNGSNGTDQITVTESTPGTYETYDVMTTTTKVYAADNNATATVVSTSHQTHDGLRSWTITPSPGDDEASTQVIDPDTWTRTSTASDGTYSVSTINSHGLPAAVEHYSADSPGQLIASVEYTYDTLKRPETTVDSRTGTTTATYVSATCDAAISVSDAGSRVTSFTYDSRGNRLSTKLPDNTLTYTSYYPDGQVKATWGSQSYPTFLTYDYAHRRKELHTWRTAPTLDQTTETPPTLPEVSSATTWNYSTFTGFLTSKRDAASKGADYEYTAAGRLWKRTWARGGTTIYTYTAGRLTNTNYPAGTPDVGITYNRLGQTRVITQASQSKIEYTYDADFALDTEIVSYDVNQDGDFVDELIDHVRTLDRSRDNLGRSNGWQLDTDHQVDYTFDTAGRLATVADGSNTFTYGYLYTQTTAADPRVGSTTGTMQDFMPYTLTKGGTPVLQTVRTYEARRDALASIQNKTGGAIRSSYAYTVNNIGQRTDLTTTFTHGAGFAANSGNTIWAYDPLGQLQSANAPETELSADADRYFQYDDIGNRKLSRTDTASNNDGTLTEYFGLVTSGTPSQPGGNSLNQYAAITKSAATLEPVHDFDGNATSYPLPAHNSLSTLDWDAENRLTSVTVNGVTTSYLYDALSRRISKTVGDVTTLYRYDGWNLIAEYILVEVSHPVNNEEFYWDWTLDFSYTWGLDLSQSLQGAGGVGGLLVVEKHGTGEYYPTFDGNGNVSEYLEADGDTAAHFEYDPFGNTVVLSEQSTGFAAIFRFRFSTKMLDQETGLYYYGYRFYDPVAGRWPSRDSIGERGGVNLYGFVANSPNSSFDILGAVTYINGTPKETTGFPDEKVSPIPGDPGIKINPFSMGFTILEYVITPDCDCPEGKKEWKLVDIAIDIHAHIFMPKDGLTEEQRTWSRNNENDHVNDFNNWANSPETQAIIAEFERSYKLSVFSSEEDCINKVREELIKALKSFKDKKGKDIGARAAFNNTKDEWDKKKGTKGPKHNWENHLKEQEEKKKEAEKQQKKEERRAKKK